MHWFPGYSCVWSCWSREKFRRGTVLASCWLFSCNLASLDPTLRLVSRGRTRRERRNTLTNAGWDCKSRHCICEHSLNEKVMGIGVSAGTGCLCNLLAATPITVVYWPTCVPKITAMRCHKRALGVAPSRLRSSIDGNFHHGIIAWLPAAITDTQNYETVVLRHWSVS